LILGENLSISAPITTVTEPKNPPKIMQLPVASENNSKAYTYLHEVRKIDSVILEHVFKSGLAYQDVFDNVVFLGYDENGTAKFAETRTTLENSFIKPKNITGSDKKYSFHLDCGESDTLYVFEAPIDLLSHCTLYLWKYGLWDNVNRLSLSGAGSKNALDGYLARNTQIKKLVFALDNDEVGTRYAEKYYKYCFALGYDCKVILPPNSDCKDWNEYLQQLSIADIQTFEEKEMTVPSEPIGVGSEQSLNKNTTTIISEDAKNCKTSDSKNLKFSTISMKELYDRIYTKNPPIIDGLLYTGTYLFVGAPKLGKSFFMAQLAYHVSTGTPLWNYAVRQGTVLYLALEDDYCRLQDRLYRMFGVESTDKLHFTTSAEHLNNGLEEQIKDFLKEYPDTNLIIIDTLQKVREIENEAYSYANDYEVITRLKKIADEYGFCLLLVHHTRKQQANDKFDMISGTNGLLGAADGAFLLHKEKRTSQSAVLEISGRDQQDQKLTLNRNTEKLLWELEKAETELWKEPPEPLIEAIGKFVNADNPTWEGTATELIDKLNLDFEIKPNVLSLKLNINASKLYNEYSIRYTNSRTHKGRQIQLYYDEPCPITNDEEVITDTDEK
jgi:RecA-family ATPase